MTQIIKAKAKAKLRKRVNTPFLEIIDRKDEYFLLEGDPMWYNRNALILFIYSAP